MIFVVILYVKEFLFFRLTFKLKKVITQKLHLKYHNFIQGDFQLRDKNILFIFQVNCPGCIVNSFPMFNELYATYQNEIGFLGLSTAFENFDLNTYVNTQLLINNKTVVGHTKQLFNQYNETHYKGSIDFPVAMDVMDEETIKSSENIELICNLNPNYKDWTTEEQKLLQLQVSKYVNTLPHFSYTFTLNQLKGTPSFVIFDKNYRVLETWFGHKSREEVIKLLKAS